MIKIVNEYYVEPTENVVLVLFLNSIIRISIVYENLIMITLGDSIFIRINNKMAPEQRTEMKL